MHSTFYKICYDLIAARFVINTVQIGHVFPYSESTVRCTIYSLNSSIRVRFLKICKIFLGQFLLSCIQFPSFLKANYEISITRIIASPKGSFLRAFFSYLEFLDRSNGHYRALKVRISISQMVKISA